MKQRYIKLERHGDTIELTAISNQQQMTAQLYDNGSWLMSTLQVVSAARNL